MAPEERSLLEACLQQMPVGTQVAVGLVQGTSARFLGAEKTAAGLKFLDNRRGVFQIGSMTKAFTGTLLAQQVQKGALALTDPVQKHLPFPLKQSGRDGAEVTLVQLASHTSGLKHHQPPGLMSHALFHGHTDEPWKDYDQARFEAYFKGDMALDARPGSRYLYSNLGMSLLGRVLSERTGLTYEALLQRDVAIPLGMTSTTTTPAKVQPQVVMGLNIKGKPMPCQDMATLTPAGGIYTCAEDLARFAQAQFEHSPAVALAHAPVFTIEEGYHVALGWHLVDTQKGWRWSTHNGGLGGYTSSLNVDLANRCAALVLGNITKEEPQGESIRRLCREFMKRLEAARR